MGRGIVAAVALGIALLAAAPAAHAADQNFCQLDPNPPEPSPRIVGGEVDGIPYNVLLPPDYATSGRRYPSLYLLPGRQYSEHSWLRKTDVAELSKDSGVIVVTRWESTTGRSTTTTARRTGRRTRSRG